MIGTEDLKFNFGCASCGYKEPNEHIDVGRVMNKLDLLFDRNDLPGAGRLLDYWRNEAVRIGDKRGELAVVSEQMGYYRKINYKDKGFEAVGRGIVLIDELGLSENISSGTIYLNAATTMKAFGKAEEALSLYDKTKTIYDAKLHATDPRFAGFYNNFALALADVGRFTEAEDAYKKAIAIMEQTPDGKPDAAISYINMAQLYGAIDDKTGDDIMLCMNKALELLRSDDNTHNGYYYFVLSKCSTAYRDMGYDKIADEMKLQVTSYYERT